ncbi:MAG: SEL1-like repeat protein [Lentisphaerae bacterium]|nr:SEL1-like repeat protein [Lentisphaerota bacterium]
MGRCYLEGKGIAQNKTEAINWYRKAAIRGDSYSKKILNDLGEVW